MQQQEFCLALRLHVYVGEFKDDLCQVLMIFVQYQEMSNEMHSAIVSCGSWFEKKGQIMIC